MQTTNGAIKMKTLSKQEYSSAVLALGNFACGLSEKAGLRFRAMVTQRYAYEGAKQEQVRMEFDVLSPTGFVVAKVVLHYISGKIEIVDQYLVDLNCW